MRTVVVKGQTVQFPDSFTDQQIDEVVQRDFFGKSVSQNAAQSHANLMAGGGMVPETGLPTYEGTSTAHEFFTGTPLGNIMTGAAKGVGNTAYHLGELVKALVPGAHRDQGPNDITKALEPSNTTQSIAKGAEQVAEFLVPGMTGEKLTAAGSKLGLAGANALVNAAGRAVPGLGGEVLRGAATGAGVAAAQGESPIVGGVAGAASPVASRALVSTARTFLNGLVGAMPSAFKGGANPGLSLLDEGVMGATKGGFLQGIRDAQSRTMAKLSTVLQRSPIVHDAMDAIEKPIDEALKNAASYPQQATMLTNLKTQLLDEAKSQASSGTIGKMSSADLNNLRSAVDDVRIAGTGDPSVPESVTKALLNVSRNLNTMLDSAAPGAKYLNHQYGNLREAEKMFVAKVARGNSQMGRLALDAGISTLPAFHDLSEGNYASAAKKAGLTFAVTQGLQSPAIISPVAQGMARVAAPAVKALGPGIASVLMGQNEPQRESKQPLYDTHIDSTRPENADVLETIPPKKILPERFKTALSADIAMPRYVGAVEDQEGVPRQEGQPNGWYGAYSGTGLRKTQDVPSALVSRASGQDWTGTLYHELGHGAWNDLTPEEHNQISRHAEALWNSSNYDEKSKIEQILKQNTSHGLGAGTEFFSELFSMYVANPSTLKNEDPKGYAMMRRFFGGREYIRK